MASAAERIRPWKDWTPLGFPSPPVVDHPRIVVVGSSCLDVSFRVDSRLRGDGTTFARAATAGPGGKGLNQAVAIRRLGGEVTFVSAVGIDFLSDYIFDFLLREGFSESQLHLRTNSRMGLAAVTVIVRGEDVEVVAPPREGSPYLSARDILADPEVIMGADVVLVTLDYGAEVLEAILDVASEGRRPKVVLNPAPLVGHAKAATRLLEGIDWVIPNMSEALGLLGLPHGSVLDETELVRRLVDLGVTNVCLTVGERGCLYGGVREDVVRYPAAQVAALDPTGASDAFCGALVVCIAQGELVPEMLEMATAAGAIATQSHGSAIAMPRQNEVLALRAARSGK